METMKTIEVSNALYGAIWSRATEDDRSEEDILRRLLQEADHPVMVEPPGSSLFDEPGFLDARFGVRFKQGFKIFRTYKGKDYSAVASGGRWHLEGDLRPHESLAALSAAIGAGTENAWFGWRYINPATNKAEFISALRNPDLIQSRSKKGDDEQ